MEAWQVATVVFSLYIGTVAGLTARLDAGKRRLAIAGAAAGLVLAAAASLGAGRVLDEWLLPPLALLTAYWTSGLLFVTPMPPVERALIGLDEALHIREIAASTPRPLAEVLEFAYAAVYPMIPVALLIHLTFVDAAGAGRFWAVVLITDYVCFGFLPWIQTRPPRALEDGTPWSTPAGLRALNLRLLGRTSIQANTFPSGHAAEALAAALLVIGAPGLLVAAMFALALAISAGAVLGRYHYAGDALAGWAVALGVWMLAPG